MSEQDRLDAMHFSYVRYFNLEWRNHSDMCGRAIMLKQKFDRWFYWGRPDPPDSIIYRANEAVTKIQAGGW